MTRVRRAVANRAEILDRIAVVVADITTLDVDAIVNAANEALAPGGGVCGAIHRAAGPQLSEACDRAGGCPTGDARITPGFRLRARHVIHAVGPVWRGGGAGEDAALARAYGASLSLARDNGLASIAFPAISTGIYGFPAERAAGIAARAVVDFLSAAAEPDRVVFACFSPQSADLHRAALARLAPSDAPRS